MTLQTRKRLLNALAAGIFLLSAAVILQGVSTPTLPEPTANASGPSGAVPLKQISEMPARALTAKDFERYWSVPLRRPLYDPPPPPPKVVEKPPPQPLRAKLIATVVAPGNSTAMLQLAGGQVVFRKVGEEIGPDEGGAKIAAIESGSVRVERGEEKLELKVQGRE